MALSKKELFNAKNAGKKIEKGMRFAVVSTGTFQDIDKDGKEVTVTALKTSTGEVYTTISATVAACVELLEEIITEEGAVEVVVNECKSNSGRSFFQLEILD